VFVQSFEAASLRRLGTQLGVPLVQLIAETGWQGGPGCARQFAQLRRHHQSGAQ
jgi:glycerophosphoryl diester phosphodiesterase